VPRFVQFDEFGSRDYLHVVERERPWPGPGQVLVRVMAAGLNPMDVKAYRDERAAAHMGVTLPSGIGQDFAGFVEEIGDGVTRFELGQAVLGTAPFSSIADFVVVPEDGQVIAKPGTITPHTKFKAEAYVLTKEEGGRHTPFFTGYRPQFYFRTTDVTGVAHLPQGVEMVMPGDNIQMEIELIAPIAMEKGLRFAIREGGRTVGAGTVSEIVE